MKRHQMILFFTIAITLYTLVNIYIFSKGLNSLSALKANKGLYIIIFTLVAVLFIIAKILESKHSSVVTDILNIIGGFWLAFMLYATMFFIISDIILLIIRLPGMIKGDDILLFKKWSFYISLILTVILMTAGFINALIPVVKEYNITIDKKAGDLKRFRIAAVSDIHLGSIIRKRSIRKLSAILDKTNPDVVLLLGDVIDGEIGPVLRDDLLEYFKCPDCSEGVYAITGNHEYIGGADRTIPYIESKGIPVLKDEVVVLKNGIQLVGRLDKDSRRFTGKERMPLATLMKKADTLQPVFLLDHQPLKLEESYRFGVDLHLSGHTHNGQMWPLNYIISGIYELSYGYMKKGNTNYIVSSGYGLWGPRVRLGSRSEVIIINIIFTRGMNSSD